MQRPARWHKVGSVTTLPIPEGDLARLLGDFAIELEDKSDAESTLREIVQSSIEVVPGTCWAGISYIEGTQIEVRAPTDQLVAELDKLQSELDEGPCLSALREQHTVRIDNMAADERWPRFSEAAVERGANSLLSFCLFIRRGTLGALNLYGAKAGVFDDESIFAGEVLAQHASVAMAGDAAEAQFQRAIDSRDVIGQAKGLLMQRNGVDGLHAFRMLTKASQETNVKLVEVARWLVQNHESGLK
ncbi:GAF and ANTAR domain-containing protein [Mycolicibacterium mengxianglii]|uniref:GAF and ANTAR domain-containing protein n=1 Tax=Mycolicibacterium mengxianglii TaxID=2736649 RepID=UPI0018EF24D6|nr:GAF and ANTAR domain-containing protein [Mycolicibacterium mengxianglii]